MTLTRRLTLFTVVWCTSILILLNVVSIVWFRSQSINRLHDTLMLELKDVVHFNHQVPHLSLANTGWESELLLIPSSVRFMNAAGKVTSASMTRDFAADLLPIADDVWQQNAASDILLSGRTDSSSRSMGRFSFTDVSPALSAPSHWLPDVSTKWATVIGVVQPFIYPNGQPGRIVVAGTLAEVSQNVRQFEQALFLADGAVLLVLAVGTYIVTRRGLRPLSRLLDHIQRVEWSSTTRVPVDHGPIEVHQLAATINQQLERIESGVREQRRFVADASHELRTPLAILAGHANLLRRWGATNPEVWQPAVRHITREVERLQRLVDTLLTLSRLDGQTGEHLLAATETMVIREMIDELVADGRLLRPDMNWVPDVKLPLRSVVTMPADTLRQALIILIDNAVRYSPETGTIEVSASVEERQVRITVSDTGSGISPEDMPHVFERFYRGTQSRQTPGAGLGLSICKQLIESVGGRIYVDSTPGKGTRVSCLVPVLEVLIAT